MRSPKVRIYSHYGEELEPTQMTDGSVGIDVRAPHDIVLPHGHKTKVDSGLVVDVSEFLEQDIPLFTLAAPRSSAGVKKGVYFLNTFGVIDPDYCGFNPDTGRIDKMYFFLGRRERHREVVDGVVYDLARFAQSIKHGSLWNDVPRAAAKDLDCSCHNIDFTKNDEHIVAWQYKVDTDRDPLVYREGERFAQLLFLPYQPPFWKAIEKQDLKQKVRGGFGSTGVK